MLGSTRATLAFAGLAVVMLVGGGLATLVSFCPSPCQTAWPLMEASNWIGLVVGILAAGMLVVQLRGAPRKG